MTEKDRAALPMEDAWRRWGTFLPERQWGTVREDTSSDGNAWTSFTHDQARSRAYRWGEDGLLGWTDRQCRLCWAPVLWNGRDPILKERLFGLSGPEGNHGEDVKEAYFYLEATPSHSYAKALYKYPQAEFPYNQLVQENARRDRSKMEFDLEDTGIFDEGRYFDVFVEYARASANDTCMRLTLCNRGPESAPLHVLPSVWFRNTWAWKCRYEDAVEKPLIRVVSDRALICQHTVLGEYEFTASQVPDAWLFTENETNEQRVFGRKNETPFVKDAFHRFLIQNESAAVNPAQSGTKAAPLYRLMIPAGGEAVLEFRLRPAGQEEAADSIAEIFEQRKREAREFYDEVLPPNATPAEREVALQANAGLLWTKQFYHYIVADWLRESPHHDGLHRNEVWRHVHARDVLSMPDKWEYPWFAAWDLAFHMIPFARIDPVFAKYQLTVLLREWYMHPNGQLPAYEWEFGDVNPPVHAWACWRVYKISAARGCRDRAFLESAFQKLLLNFTWWVNRKDSEGNNLFSGGFLGLDNVGVFDRSRPLPGGGSIHQADGTAWMGFYCLTMLAMALELAMENPVYEDMASKFFEHFIAISDAINHFDGTGLWDEADGFYYDHLKQNGTRHVLRTRSMVGLIPLLAVEILDDAEIGTLHGFRKRMDWFIENRPDLARLITWCDHCQVKRHSLLALPTRERLIRVLQRVFDEEEFLSPYGVRSLSAAHAREPFVFYANGEEHRITYAPAESPTAMFGGNSNWRGPVWFPLNYLLIEALERYDHFHGEDVSIEVPRGSGKRVSLKEAARLLSTRLAALLLPDASGVRPCHGGDDCFASDPHWKNLVLFHEYFHGDTGRGLGAAHQTGWTALVTRCLEDLAKGRNPGT